LELAIELHKLKHSPKKIAMKEIVVVVAIIGVLYFIGSLTNKDNHKDFRFGNLTNVMYGLITVLVISVVLGILNSIFR
jgi:hypothetical protein